MTIPSSPDSIRLGGSLSFVRILRGPRPFMSESWTLLKKLAFTWKIFGIFLTSLTLPPSPKWGSPSTISSIPSLNGARKNSLSSLKVIEAPASPSLNQERM